MPFLSIRRWAQLLTGLFLYGVSLAMMIRAGLGVSPWDVLGQGASLQTGIPFGWMTNIIGALVLLLWIPLRQKPGVGTVLNVLLVGPSAEVGLALISEPDQLWARVLLFTGGLVLLAVASGLYIGARLGPGPRDGLMTGVHSRYGLPIWLVRTTIEATVLGLGWVLGGTVGLGTVAFALLIGPLINFLLPLLRVPERRTSTAALAVEPAP
ncbi:membrane protein YczE [Arthrobacter sp. H41]|uniref:membrane protein YczE n=1 Tax=Arthrobacter sp. H41 TaxID=1312978 RepID=UPI0004AEF3E3|nr:membrane protein [Arthrobacter sp. H41]